MSRPAWADETVDFALQLAAYRCRIELSQLTRGLVARCSAALEAEVVLMLAASGHPMMRWARPGDVLPAGARIMAIRDGEVAWIPPWPAPKTGTGETPT